MKKLLLVVTALLLFLTSNLLAQNTPNLNFEKLDSLKTNARGWVATVAGEVNRISIDTSKVQSGNNSIKLEGTEKDAAALYLYKLPANFIGDTIKLTGFIKSENIKNGWAGLYLQINGSTGVLVKGNTQQKGVKGTKDWKEYSISLPLDLKSTEIIVGGMLSGQGTAWIDNFKVFIDGVPLAKMTKVPVNKKIKAEQPFKSFLTLKNLSTQEISNLALLGKVWGFLKYHHPAVATGEKDWDKALFSQIDAIKPAQNVQQRSNILMAWIKSLGDVKPCDSCKETTAFVKMNPDFAWMNDRRSLAPELIDQLNYIQRNRYIGNPYYVSTTSTGKPGFSMEKPYPNADLNDDGVRMLALFRYWNVIQYYYPYRYSISDWNKILSEFISKFSRSADSVSYRLTFQQLISRINDSNANISDSTLQKHFGDHYTPFAVRFIDNKLVVFKYYNESQTKLSALRPGDLILKIDSAEVEDEIKSLEPFVCASNSSAFHKDIASSILRGNSEYVDITYEREGITSTTTVHRLPMETIENDISDLNELSDLGKDMNALIDSEIGYININTVEENSLPEIFAKFKNTKGIIIDMRSSNSTITVPSLSKYLKPYPTPFVRYTAFNLEKPGSFEESTSVNSGLNNPDYYKSKVVLLINESTEHQPEFITIALQSGPNVTTIGSQTAGASAEQSTVVLPGNLKTEFSGKGIYYPDGRETQRTGIKPNIEIKPSIEGLSMNKDEVLDAAIQFIKEGK